MPIRSCLVALFLCFANAKHQYFIADYGRKENIMFSQLTTTGRVTADLELKTSTKNIPYVSFSIAVNKGKKEDQKTTFYKCVVFREEAEKIVKAGVKKGSLLAVSGEFEMSEYESKTRGMVTEPKITIHYWKYLFAGGAKQDNNYSASTDSQDIPDGYEPIDCDDELPLGF